MDNKFILRVEKVIQSIKAKLLLNEEIRKLLFYESDEIVEDVEIPTIQLVEGNIFTQPVVNVTTEPPFNKKIFIAISLSASGFKTYNEVDHAIKIAVMCHSSDWIYGAGKVRVLHLVQEVINELDSKKFACAEVLEYEQLMQTVINEDITGYSIIFSVADGVGEPEKE